MATDRVVNVITPTLRNYLELRAYSQKTRNYELNYAELQVITAISAAVFCNYGQLRITAQVTT
jgi:hypothetical protein